MLDQCAKSSLINKWVALDDGKPHPHERPLKLSWCWKQQGLGPFGIQEFCVRLLEMIRTKKMKSTHVNNGRGKSNRKLSPEWCEPQNRVSMKLFEQNSQVKQHHEEVKIKLWHYGNYCELNTYLALPVKQHVSF